MRFRQIHLDFHTSGRIPGIGSKFDGKAFAKSLKEAYVDSVTVFSKCHHGYAYHPTNHGQMHPHLEFDLLRAQIDALHAEGINAPIYTTSTWDELAATNHPEWRTVSPEGGSPRQTAEPNGAGWAFLDYSSPYLDYLCDQVEEIMQNYGDGDGIFMDICFQLPTVSVYAQQQMEQKGMDWTSPDDRSKFAEMVMENFYDRINASVRKYDSKMPLFYNSGHIRRGLRDHYHKHYTHLELESLPTAGWGYDHFPLSARYVEQMGLEYLGMTGKFHFLWGEVGGYKKPDALLYECGAMIAHGAKCSIGDHLHPTGEIDATTMDIIRPAYKWVAEREPWAENTTNRAEIGVLSLEAMVQPGLGVRPVKSYEPDEGSVRVLLEGQFTFDVLDEQSDFSGYKLLILPDSIPINDALRQRIQDYAANGGKVLLTGKSGINPDKGFMFDVGAEWSGTSTMENGDYLMPIADLKAEGVNNPLFMYHPSEQIRVTDGRSLGEIHNPYMDRQPQHFSGHVNAPSELVATDYASGSQKGNFTYVAHPLFSAYHHTGAVTMLEIAEKTIKLALGETKMVETTLPRAGRSTVRHQASQNRDVVHLLHATPALRGNIRGHNIQPIQDLVTLANIDVILRTTKTPKAVNLVPENKPIEFELNGDQVSFTVPQVRGHQMIEVNYA